MNAGCNAIALKFRDGIALALALAVGSIIRSRLGEASIATSEKQNAAVNAAFCVYARGAVYMPSIFIALASVSTDS